MKKGFILLFILSCLVSFSKAAFLHNDYSYLQEITFELYTEDVPAYKVPEQIKSIEESLMFEILHATWKDKHWVAYTLNKDLLGTFRVGQPALLDDGDKKKLYFVAAFPGSAGGLDLYVSEYANGKWSKPKNLGKSINTVNNESNPGLLNDHTLTYSSGGIIKKLDLNTLKVVDLEEAGAVDKKEDVKVKDAIQNKEDELKSNINPVAAIGDNSTAAPAGSTSPQTSDYGAIGDNSTAMPAGGSGEGKSAMQNQSGSSNHVAFETAKDNLKQTPRVQQNKNETLVVPNQTTSVNTITNSSFGSVESLGIKTREEMLAKYKTAIQLGAFTSPKWELFNQLSKYGKLITYKNDNGMNVVWITGFASHASAEAILPQVKSIAGFENAYITGK